MRLGASKAISNLPELNIWVFSTHKTVHSHDWKVGRWPRKTKSDHSRLLHISPAFSMDVCFDSHSEIIHVEILNFHSWWYWPKPWDSCHKGLNIGHLMFNQTTGMFLKFTFLANLSPCLLSLLLSQFLSCKDLFYLFVFHVREWMCTPVTYLIYRSQEDNF